MWPWKRKALSDYERAMPREVLVQGSRVVVVDDEQPLIIDELRKAGFAVDHDASGADLRPYDQQLYDVAVVDFHGVGGQLGAMQGLELVRYIRRVSPRTRVVAHTSRSLSASEADFFTLSHTVLPKDLGLGDSLALIEGELKKALSKQHLFDALIGKLAGSAPERRAEIEKELLKALAGKNDESFKRYLSKSVGFTAEKAVDVILSKMFA